MQYTTNNLENVPLLRARRLPSLNSYYPEWLVRLSQINLSKAIYNYNKILILCHNNPDADTIACGFAIQRYIENVLGIKNRSKIVYGGTEEIKKSNIKLMLQSLDIEITHIDKVALHGYNLVIAVDCQPGESNVYYNSQLYTKDFIVIDHHKRNNNTEYNKLNIIYEWIDSSYSSCSTMVYELLYSLGFNTDRDLKVSTALMYGLYTDSNRFQSIISKQDELMRTNIKHDNSIITALQGRNITKDELKVIAKAISNYKHNQSKRYAITGVEYCDSNILGFVCDTLIEVDTIDICVAFLVREEFIKLSVRSCSESIKACDIAKCLTHGVLNSDGGGTLTKAGGKLHIQSFLDYLYKNKQLETEQQTMFNEFITTISREDLEDILYTYIYNKLDTYIKSEYTYDN